MNNCLKDAVKYSNTRIPLNEIGIENYITTDNLLQNKQGKTKAESLPPSMDKVTEYRKGDVLISNIRPYLKKIWYASNSGGNSADILTLRVNNRFNSKFIYYCLFQDLFFEHMMNGSKGTKMPRGDKSQILEFPIPDYSFMTQQSIAKVLSDLDDKIELNNKINKELESMAKTLYDYWFVQFDFPNEEGKPYKTSGGKMVYNAELNREIPEGWEVKSLFKSCNVQYGYAFNTYFFNDEYCGVPVIRIRDILENTISAYSTEPNIEDKYKINKGELLIGMDGNFHINYWSKEGCYLNQRVVKLKETTLPTMYIKYQIEPFILLREKTVSRTTVGHLSDKDLKTINVIHPSNNILKKASPFFNSTIKEIIQLQNESYKLAELRDWLLPMLMNGQVKVKDVEHQ